MITTPPPLTATLDNKQLQPAALPLPCTLHPLLQIQKQPRHPRPPAGPSPRSSVQLSPGPLHIHRSLPDRK